MYPHLPIPRPSATDPSMTLHVPPQPATARRVRDAVVAFARDHDVDAENLAEFLTAIGEAIANAVEHSATATAIDVCCRIGGDRIVAKIQDYGRGFDTAALDCALPDATAERGRGVPIMRSCSDVFRIASVIGEGTAVVLERHLSTGGRRRSVSAGRLAI